MSDTPTPTLDQLLAGLDRDAIAAQIAAGEEQVQTLEAQLAKARRVLKILDGEPLRTPRGPRKKAPVTSAAPTAVTASESTAPTKSKVWTFLKNHNGPMSVGDLSKALRIDYGTVYSALKSNAAMFEQLKSRDWKAV